MGQEFHTKFTYTDTINNGITIQNSYPRGGLGYKAPNGKGYAYVVFWTRITNHTAADLKLHINFPVTPILIPSAPDILFNVYVPEEEMSLKKEEMTDYGLDLTAFLDDQIDMPTEVSKIICAGEASLLYSVVTSSEGVNGVMRTGFELQKQDLYYRINGHKFYCGTIKH